MSRARVADVAAFLESFAPPALAEDWDNVGLLIGDAGAAVERMMTCLTVTEDVADEAVREQAQLIVAHHPILFRAVQRITNESPEGRTLLKLLRAGIAVYSPHTAFDSAAGGINQRLAESLGLREIEPIRRVEGDSAAGGGRLGNLPVEESLDEFLTRVRNSLQVRAVEYVGGRQERVRRVGVACGSAAEFLADAASAGCQVLLTGEARFHACLEARAIGVAMVLAGHYATERPGVEALAGVLQKEFSEMAVWASRVERNPLHWSAS